MLPPSSTLLWHPHINTSTRQAPSHAEHKGKLLTLRKNAEFHKVKGNDYRATGIAAGQELAVGGRSTEAEVSLQEAIRIA